MSYQNILEYGTFYYPAFRHYNREVDVVCDRCQTHNLNACIGYGSNQDLCLTCVNELTRRVGNTHIGFPPLTPIVRPSIIRSPIIRPPIDPHDYFNE